jgi:hypothetical protein
MGRRTAMESPDIGRKEYDYDRYGNLSRESDSVLRGKGTFIGYQYDGLNRLIKIDYPESADTAYEYGEPGAPDGRANRITKVTDETGSTEYRYGKLGETAEEKRMINHVMAGQGESRTRTIGYTSNYLGQLERIIHDDGEIISYGYNAGGQIRTVTGHKESTDGTGEFGYVKDVGYDEFGQRVVMEYGNGVRTEYSYNPERRWLERIVTVDGTGTRLQNITYDINPVGNVRGYENAADGYSTKQTYGYDNLYQLVKVDGESKNYQAGSGLVTMSSAYSQVFGFDGAGNGKLVGKASSERTMGTRNGDNLNYSDTIILIACNTGKNDEKSGTSFAQKLADEFGPGTVVKAPDDYIYVFYHFGEVAVGPYYPDIEGPYDRRLKLVHPIDNYRYLKTFEYRSPSERRRR